MSEIISKKMYIMKAIAIFAAVLAHSNYSDISRGLDYDFVARLVRIGVFIFFVQGGYYFRRKDWKTFIHGNFFNLIVPWFSMGTVMYAAGLVLKADYADNHYISYILGNGSLLYFCTMMLTCRIAAQFFPQKRRAKTVVCSCAIALTLASLMITAIGTDRDMTLFDTINSYLNVFNWIGIFAFGMLLKEYALIEKLLTSSRKVKFIICIICVGIFICGCFEERRNYWSYLGIYNELALSTLALLTINSFHSPTFEGILIKLGKTTFPVFILHYPLICLMNVFQFQQTSLLFGLIRPIICILIVYALIMLGSKIARLLKLQKLYATLTGIK